MQKFQIKTTGIFICAIYSTIMFLRGIFVQVFSEYGFNIENFFKYSPIVDKMFNVSFCVFLFLLYLYNKEKMDFKVLKINVVIACCLFVLAIAPYFPGMVNGVFMQYQGFALTRSNISLSTILFIFETNGPALAFMLLGFLKYKKMITVIFILLQALYMQFLINLMFHITGGLLNLITFLVFMLFFILNTIVLLLYAIKVEMKRNRTD